MSTTLRRNAMKKQKTQIIFNINSPDNITVESCWGDDVEPSTFGKVMGLISRGIYTQPLVESVYKYGQATGNEDVADNILQQASDTVKIIDNYKRKDIDKKNRKNFTVLWVPVERRDENPAPDEYAGAENMMERFRAVREEYEGPNIVFPKKDSYWGFTNFNVEPYMDDIMGVDGVEYGEIMGCYTIMLTIGMAFETKEVLDKIDRVISGKK